MSCCLNAAVAEKMCPGRGTRYEWCVQIWERAALVAGGPRPQRDAAHGSHLSAAATSSGGVRKNHSPLFWRKRQFGVCIGPPGAWGSSGADRTLAP